ncbi:hypothetical protein Ae406Ps2_6473c [Pseudonocardia sp. Ae406_Ps2]|nr:hypothetical protein Ae406Ps2_6473c [Pseudonocardia sp. Ae406_Ps2]
MRTRGPGQGQLVGDDPGDRHNSHHQPDRPPSAGLVQAVGEVHPARSEAEHDHPGLQPGHRPVRVPAPGRDDSEREGPHPQLSDPG